MTWLAIWMVASFPRPSFCRSSILPVPGKPITTPYETISRICSRAIGGWVDLLVTHVVPGSPAGRRTTGDWCWRTGDYASAYCVSPKGARSALACSGLRSVPAKRAAVSLSPSSCSAFFKLLPNQRRLPAAASGSECRAAITASAGSPARWYRAECPEPSAFK